MIHWRSVRVRLTLWNVGVLAATLVAFGAGIYWDVRAGQAAGVDRQLRERAHHFAADWARGHPGPGLPPPGLESIAPGRIVIAGGARPR